MPEQEPKRDNPNPHHKKKHHYRPHHKNPNSPHSQPNLQPQQNAQPKPQQDDKSSSGRQEHSSDHRSKYRGRNKRRSYNKYYPKKQEEKKVPVPIVYEVCPLCSKDIREPHTAILDKESQKNAHFECILEEIKKAHPVIDQEKIYYLGGGSFGIVIERRFRNRFTFSIKEKIQYIERPKKTAR